MAGLSVALQKHVCCQGLLTPASAKLKPPKNTSISRPLRTIKCKSNSLKSALGARYVCKVQTEQEVQAVLHRGQVGRSRGQPAQSSALSEALTADNHYVLRPVSKKATGYVPPYSKPLLDSLLVELPPHLLKELRTKVQTRVKSQSGRAAGDPSEDEFLFEQAVQLVGEHNRNLLYQLPGETLEEVQSYLSERGRLLYIAESKIQGAGRGGFAKAPIKAGTVITQYINESELWNAPGKTSTASTAQAEAKESTSQGEQKYDYHGSEVDWPAYAIPHLLNDHSCLRGPDLYADPSLKMAQYLRRIATLNNVAFVERFGERFAIATREIEKDEELLWTYGISWWLDVERENMFMVILWIASEERGPSLGESAQDMIRGAWEKIRLLEEAAQAGKDMELQVVGQHGPKRREEVYVMQPLPKDFEDYNVLRKELVPRYGELLEQWKRDTLDEETLGMMQSALFG